MMLETQRGGKAPTPLHGAALRWLLERCDVGRCMTQENLVAILETCADACAWARGQPAPNRYLPAYSWAASEVEKAARARLSTYDNSRAVQEAYDGMAKPPEKKEGEQ